MIARVIFEFPPDHEGWAWEAGQVIARERVAVEVADAAEDWLTLPEGTWVDLDRLWAEDVDAGLEVHAFLTFAIGLIVEKWKVSCWTLLKTVEWAEEGSDGETGQHR